MDHIRGRFSYNLTSLFMFEIPEIEQPVLIGNDQIVKGVVDQVEITKVRQYPPKLSLFYYLSIVAKVCTCLIRSFGTIGI